MSALMFDSHEAADTYKRAGFTEAQVEAVVDIDRRTAALPDLSQLATKADLAAEMASVRTEIDRSKTDTLKWTVGLTLTQTLAIIGAMLAILHAAK